jgi:N-acetylglutamate synthase-like GNAT family acetyltransferase
MLFRPSVLARLHSILAYPLRRRDRQAAASVLEAELLAIAVDAKEYGQGHGKMLIQAFEASLRQWDVRAYRVVTNAADKESNAFYRATGFTPAGTVRHHALTLQAYEKMIGGSASVRVFP